MSLDLKLYETTTKMFSSAKLGYLFQTEYYDDIRKRLLDGNSASVVVEDMGLMEQYSKISNSHATFIRAISFFATGFQSKTASSLSYGPGLTDEERVEWKRKVDEKKVVESGASVLGVIGRGLSPWEPKDERLLLKLSYLPVFTSIKGTNAVYLSKVISNMTGVNRTERGVGNKLKKIQKYLFDNEILDMKTAEQSAEVFNFEEEVLNLKN